MVDNAVESVDALKDMTTLKFLYLDMNPINDVYKVSSLTKLSILSINMLQGVKDLYFINNLTNLKKLRAQNNEIEDISVLNSAKFSYKMDEIDLDINKIQNISPIKNVFGLSVLGLSYNCIDNFKVIERIIRDLSEFRKNHNCEVFNSTYAGVDLDTVVNDMYVGATNVVAPEIRKDFYGDANTPKEDEKSGYVYKSKVDNMGIYGCSGSHSTSFDMIFIIIGLFLRSLLMKRRQKI